MPRSETPRELLEAESKRSAQPPSWTLANGPPDPALATRWPFASLSSAMPAEAGPATAKAAVSTPVAMRARITGVIVTQPGSGCKQRAHRVFAARKLRSKKDGAMNSRRGSRIWYLLLPAPYVGLLWVPFYNRTTPELLGIPFFYWYQFLWVPITASITWFVYVATRPPAAEDEGARP